MGRRRIGICGAAVLVAVLIGGCADGDGREGADSAPSATSATTTTTPRSELAGFCAQLAETDGEVEESYVGSAEHQAAVGRLLSAAPAEIRPDVQVFRDHLRTSIDPSRPESADLEGYPAPVTSAIARIAAYRSDHC